MFSFTDVFSPFLVFSLDSLTEAFFSFEGEISAKRCDCKVDGVICNGFLVKGLSLAHIRSFIDGRGQAGKGGAYDWLYLFGREAGDRAYWIPAKCDGKKPV